MYKLLVLYPYPDDPQAFLDYYRQHHLPLVKQLPGLLASRFGQHAQRQQTVVLAQGVAGLVFATPSRALLWLAM